MNAISVALTRRFATFGLCLRFCKGLSRLTATVSVLFLPLMVAIAEEDQIKEFPGLGEPRIVYSARVRMRYGYWTSIAFSPDNSRLIGSLVRHPGSTWLDLLTQRVGEVRSFGLVGDDKDSKIVATALNTQFGILTVPSGAAKEPLLLARWHLTRPKEVVVFQAGKYDTAEAIVGEFQIHRPEERVTGASLHVELTPGAETLVFGTGGMVWKKQGDRRTWWGDVKAWDLHTGKTRIADAWEGDQVLSVACSTDGKFVAVAGGHWTGMGYRGPRYDGRLVCWDAGFEKKLLDLVLPHHQVHCLAFSPDGQVVATGGHDGTVKLIDLTHGTVVKSLDVQRHSSKAGGRVERLAFSPNGQLLAAGYGYLGTSATWGESFVIDVAKAQVYGVPSSQEGGLILCIAFSPNGKYLAAGGIDGVLKLWQLDGGK